MGRKAVAVACFLSVLGVSGAGAGTTGQLGGFVHDDMGNPLEGVSIAASSPSQIGATQLATTGPDGSFRFPRLAPGYYSVLVELVGYAPRQLEQVQVRLDRVTNVHVTLQATSFSGQIEVAEMTPVVDPVQVSTGQTFTSTYITETRTDWDDLIKQTPGASNDNFRRVMGSTPQDGGYLLDGTDSTNWYQRFPNPAALTLPFDAIHEVAVHSAGFEAEFGQATGAVVNVTTKSGGNRFAGTFDVRYTDSSFETAGEHYDPDEQESENASYAATLGGPILRDRLWFFVSYSKAVLKGTPTGAPTTYENDTDTFLAKLTWQPSAAWQVVGRYSYTPFDEYNLGSSQFRTADATSDWRREPAIAGLEAVGVLAPNVLWGVRLSRKEWNETGVPSNGDLETIAHYNLVTGISSANWHGQWYALSDQNEISTDFSWLVDGAGSHELKLGVSLGDPAFVDDECYNGSGQRCAVGVEGFLFQDWLIDGVAVPTQMGVEAAEGPKEYGGKFHSAFAQDSWRVRPNLNLKLGLRWDRVTYDNEVGEIAELSKLQPRLGFSWDLFGDGTTMLRGSWGRFMHPGTTIFAGLANDIVYPTEFWTSCSFLGLADPELCAAVAAAYGLGYRNDPEGWDVAGWVLDPDYVIESEPSQVADDLSAGYADEWMVGFERELTRRTSVEVSYVNKVSKNGFDDTCNGNIPEPTPDSECAYYVVTNLSEVKWDYEGLILRLESRAHDNLHLLASWVISESKGSMDANTGATPNFDFYPYHFVNRYGFLSDHSRHRVKLNGYWLLPYDFSLAFDGWWDSEFRWTPFRRPGPGDLWWGQEFMGPRGSGKGNSRHQIDLQLAKGFRVGPTRLVVLGSIINLTDSQSEDRVCGAVTGCGEYEFGEGTSWQQPRRYELGFRVEF